MVSSDSAPLILHADREHSGVRAVVLLTLVVAGWLSFLLVRLLLSRLFPESDYLGILSCLGALPLALFMVWAIEQWLKRVWPSGRKLTLSGDTIKASDPGQEHRILSLSSNLTYLNWFFHLSEYARGGQERRVPKRWLCLAGQLQQDEQRLVAYTYMPARKAASLIENETPEHKFHQIFPGDVYDKSFRSRIGPPSRPVIPASVLSGRDGRYWLAERRRWAEGFELSPEDFEIMIHFVQNHLIADDEPIP